MRALLVALLLSTTLVAAGEPRAADVTAAARAAFDEGLAQYTLGQFDLAIESFKRAYALSKAPGLLFNLAQACRLAKRYEEALHFYRGYLRQRPHAPNRRDVLAFITELERRVETPPPDTSLTSLPPSTDESAAEANPAERPPPPGTPLASPEAPPPAMPKEPRAMPMPPAPPMSPVVGPNAPPPPSRARPYAIAAAVLGGLGVAALATGIYFGVTANQLSDRLVRQSQGGPSWSAEMQRSYDEGRRDATVATALFAVGGAAAGVGVVLGIVAARKRSQRFTLTPGPGGASLVWSCAF